MSTRSQRRHFLKTASTLAVAGSCGMLKPSRVLGANERLNIGVIGVGGRGASDLAAVASESIVALCDVDQGQLAAAASSYPSAKTYSDYRELLLQDNLDAVVIATPDHHHAPATVRALRRGLHVYCEKPLTHTVAEARLVASLASENKLVTQMGTQNHEHPGYLRLVELLQSNAIGQVTEVHVITDRPGKWWPQGVERPTDRPAVPVGLQWDLWLGPAEERDYHPAYAPFRWRGWWDFGCGAIGDMAIHLMDPAFWALQLGGPVKVTSKGPPVDPYSAPAWMETKFEFGARAGLSPVDVYWYEGTAQPKDEIKNELPMNGSLFIGEHGRIAIAHDGFPNLLPEKQFADFKGPEPYLPMSPGHHVQWIEACKLGTRTGSPFSYAGPFTEVVLLGNIAYRVGKTIDYDPVAMEVTNIPEANQFLSKTYRDGWGIEAESTAR